MFGPIGKLAGNFLKKRFNEKKEQPGLLKSIGDFKSWRQGQQKPQQGFGPGSSFGGPQQGGGGFQKPGGGSPLMGGNFKRSPFPQMEQPAPAPVQAPMQLGGAASMPGTGGAEQSPWAPQPPKPAGGQGLGGGGGFMPPQKPGTGGMDPYGSFGRGWGG